MENTYIPGICNIGKAEKRVRFYSGLIILGFTIVVYIIIRALDLPNFSLIILTPLIFSGILNVLQSSISFCVKFGILQKYNFGSFGNSTSVYGASEINKDRVKSVKIIIGAFALTLIIMLVVFII